MAQNYTEFPNTQTLNVSYGKMMDNFKTFRSLNAGTVFPSTLLYEGTPCWREDLDELYIYDGTSAWNKINAANADTLGTYAETAFGRLAANAVITGNWQIKNAEPSLETWEDDAPTDAKRWKIRSVAGSLRLSTYSDTGSFLSDAIIFGRNGDITEGGNLLSARYSSISHNHSGVYEPLGAAVAALQAVYPIGSLYFNATNGTNPATLLGFGNWVAFGAGRVPVGFDAGDANFNTLGETGGSKDAVNVSHSHSISDSGHAHGYIKSVNSSGDRQSSGSYTSTTSATTDTSTTGISINSAGVSGTNKNLQPYITVHIWSRIS